LACTKDKGANTVPVLTNKAIVSFRNVSPEANQVIARDSVVYINMVASASQILHGYEVSIRNVTTQQLYFEAAEHIHDTIFHINEEWINELDAATEVYLSLKVNTDHVGNFEQKTIRFRCKAK
jgi:hypothetical protein